MPQPTRILLKTTIPATDDDWHIGRFSLLADVHAYVDNIANWLARKI